MHERHIYVSLTTINVISLSLPQQIFDSQITKEIASNVVFSQIVLSYSGHMMFVGTQTGAIRAIKFPLGDSDDYQEHRAHSAPVTKLCVSHDDSHLFSCSEDGCVYVFRISDKEERGVGRDQTLVFTDEVCGRCGGRVFDA